MKPIRIPVAICFLLFAAPLVAQSFSTGANWRKWTDGERVMYVNGYADGMSAGFFTTLRVMDEERWSKVIREGIKKDPLLKPLDSSNITVGQLFEGVNKFFEDYRNLHVPVRSALEIILEEAMGNIVVTEEYLQRIRQLEAQKQK